ncbi:hypothetical protein [Amycolatopsis speibonae]|uniref:MarR family transcriptional regulator n=1 Tax=Amycolatopsis speibonae TaxID=1450224 RepID=A0ABV7P6F0_9PSEU
MPGTSTESIGIVTRMWQLAKLFGEDRRRVLHDSDVDSATLDLLSMLRRSSPPYSLTTREPARLTSAGHALVEQTVDRVLERELELVSGLSEEQRAQLASLLKVLLGEVQNRCGDHGVSHVGDVGTAL